MFQHGFLLLLSFRLVLSTMSCQFNAKLKQNLKNEGFHRNLTYEVMFSTEVESNKWLYKDCIVGIDQTLPPGVYAYPDELRDLRRANKINAVPKNRVNIELPKEESSESTVYVMEQIAKSHADMWVPLHARYHKALAGGGLVRNIIDAPKLFLRCPDQRLEVCNQSGAMDVKFLCNGSSKEKCSWREISYTLMSDTVIWDVPVGNTDHYYIVAVGTGLVVTIGSLYLLKAIHEHKMTVRKKHY